MDAYVEVAANVPEIKVRPDTDTVIAKLRDIHESGLFDAEPDVAVAQLAGVEPFNAVDDLSRLVDHVWKGNNAAE